MPFLPNKNGASALDDSALHKIEGGVPLPKGRRWSRWKSLADLMKKGDSILFDQEREALRFYQAVSKSGKTAKRKVDGGWRVWKLF